MLPQGDPALKVLPTPGTVLTVRSGSPGRAQTVQLHFPDLHILGIVLLSNSLCSDFQWKSVNMCLTTQRVRLIIFFVTGTGGYYLTYFSNTTQNVIHNKALFITRPVSQSVHHFTLE